MDARAGETHLAVCRQFGVTVAASNGKWHLRSPCDAWDARGVLEHVIGFHDVLLLRPLGLKPDRPRDDPRRRWELTFDRLRELLGREGSLERVVEVPAVGRNQATQADAANLLPRLTRDVLVHTWDLARAVGADDRLDPIYCAMFFEQLPADADALNASGMFAPSVAVDDHSDVQTKLLARLGRDPQWQSQD
jgi:uncharacterized protein (TIGR03086 family)